MGIESVPDRMLACQVIEYHKPYKIHEVPTPKDLDEWDILVKPAVSSLCHTDSMVVNGDFKTKLPCTASHEGSGTVVAVGSSVKDFKEGDRVMCGISYHKCGVCHDCQTPDTQYCHKNLNTGVTRDGNFAEYVAVDSRSSAKMPDAVSFQTAAPLACAGCTVYRAVLTAECHAGEWLAIVGSGGGLGHLGCQFAKALGINVIGIDARDEGLALSKECGADVVIDARKGEDEVIKKVQSVTGGEGVKATVNVSDAESAAELACAVTMMHGTMVQVAQPARVSVPFVEFVFRDVRIKGSLVCNPTEARQMLDVVAQHGISVKTNPVNGLNEIPKLVELAHSGKMSGKGVVIVDQSQLDEDKKHGRGTI
ncbi:GroES-like protein [Rhizodiscina lignyota]|uniref:GroES-like protein n=1 Tax=Rhizodiscina lignyota TaxID=1504668 RepID=A0A9P4MA89_9PEZI|nr:GroES-like protein [Rhizodiscina lignyota]